MFYELFDTLLENGLLSGSFSWHLALLNRFQDQPIEDPKVYFTSLPILKLAMPLLLELLFQLVDTLF
jgi:hypothetical protein